MSRIEEVQLTGILQFTISIEHVEKRLSKNFQIILENLKAQKHKLELLHQENLALKEEMRTSSSTVADLVRQNSELAPALAGVASFSDDLKRLKVEVAGLTEQQKKTDAKLNVDKEVLLKRIDTVVSQVRGFDETFHSLNDQTSSMREEVRQMLMRAEFREDLQNPELDGSKPTQPGSPGQGSPAQNREVKQLKTRFLQKMQKLSMEVFGCVKKDDLVIYLKPLENKLKLLEGLTNEKLDVLHYDSIMRVISRGSEDDEAQGKGRRTTGEGSRPAEERPKQEPHEPVVNRKVSLPRPTMPSVVQIVRENEDRTMVLEHDKELTDLREFVHGFMERLKVVEQGQQKSISVEEDSGGRLDQLEAQIDEMQTLIGEKVLKVQKLIEDKMKSVGEGLARGLEKGMNEKRSVSVYKKDEPKHEYATTRLDGPTQNQKEGLKYELQALGRELESKLLQKDGREEALRRHNDLLARLSELRSELQKKADFETIKKSLGYFQNKVNQIGYIILQREQDMQALAAKRGWSCLSCEKKLERMDFAVGGQKHWNQLPGKYEAPKLGGFGKMGESSRAYRNTFLEKRRGKDESLPLIGKEEEQ